MLGHEFRRQRGEGSPRQPWAHRYPRAKTWARVGAVGLLQLLAAAVVGIIPTEWLYDPAGTPLGWAGFLLAVFVGSGAAQIALLISGNGWVAAIVASLVTAGLLIWFWVTGLLARD